jgi:hypothetical protein
VSYSKPNQDSKKLTFLLVHLCVAFVAFKCKRREWLNLKEMLTFDLAKHLYACAVIQHIAVHISISLAVSTFPQDTTHLRLFQGVQPQEANVEQHGMINRPL